MFRTLLTKFYGTNDMSLLVMEIFHMHDKSLMARGILTILDIPNEVGELLSWSETEQKFSLNVAQILNWLCLLSCILKAWKRKLAANSERIYSTHGNLKTKQTSFITSKTAYQILLKFLVRPAIKTMLTEKILCSCF